MTVHDVEVQPVSAGTINADDLTGKVSVIGRQQRGCDYHA
jgi:hypothetical protein